MKTVKVDFEGDTYVFELRYMTAGDRRQILRKAIKGEFPKQIIDPVLGDAYLRAVSIECILKNDEEIYKRSGDLDKDSEALDSFPEILFKPIEEKIVEMNPL